MNEIKLVKRYPHSRTEDITDAYMRGFEDGMKVRSGEVDKLRELLSEAREELADMYGYMDGGYAWPSIEDDPRYGPFYKRLCSELGVGDPE